MVRTHKYGIFFLSLLLAVLWINPYPLEAKKDKDYRSHKTERSDDKSDVEDEKSDKKSDDKSDKKSDDKSDKKSDDKSDERSDSRSDDTSDARKEKPAFLLVDPKPEPILQGEPFAVLSFSIKPTRTFKPKNDKFDKYRDDLRREREAAYKKYQSSKKYKYYEMHHRKYKRYQECLRELEKRNKHEDYLEYRRKKKLTNIRRVRFTLPKDYEVNFATEPPPDWKMQISPQRLGNHIVDFYCMQRERQIEWDVKQFDIVVTGVKDGPIVASAKDTYDTLLNLEAWDSKGRKCILKNSLKDFSWLRQGLYSELYIDLDTLPVEETTEFILRVQNRTNADNNITPVKPVRVTKTSWDKTFNGKFKYISGPVPQNLLLSPGETKEFVYVYQAIRKGSVRYEAGAKVGKKVTSQECISNEAFIGDVGALMEVPLTAASGETIPLTLHVTNHTEQNLTNLTPQTISFTRLEGLETPIYVSGPNPKGPVPTLAPGAQIDFYWEYKVSGPAGAQYVFTAQVKTDEGVTIRDQSDVGDILLDNVLVSPSEVSVGDEGMTFTFDINNGDTAEGFIDQITIYHPDAFFAKTANPVHYIDSSPTGGNTRAWKTSRTGNGVLFRAPKGDELKPGQTMNLTLTYNIPDETWYPDETTLKFIIDLENTTD